VDASIYYSEYSTPVWIAFSAGVSALAAWLMGLRRANASIERARIKMTTELATTEAAERSSFRATLMAEVTAMRVLLKECETERNMLQERLIAAEAQILILKASNEIMDRWVSFFKDRNSSYVRAIPDDIQPEDNM
jgi:hypothetical protein